MKSNFICTPDLTDDVRYSIYYLMKLLPIEFSIDDIRGILMLRNSDTGNLLKADDIMSMIEISDPDKIKDLVQEFITDGLPTMKQTEPTEYKEYGWLSPMGDFYEGEFGEHEKAAQNICKELGFEIDHSSLCREILASKGWAIVHDPTGCGRYIVSSEKDLTKKQKDFLFGYFSDMGMEEKANEYV